MGFEDSRRPERAHDDHSSDTANAANALAGILIERAGDKQQSRPDDAAKDVAQLEKLERQTKLKRGEYLWDVATRSLNSRARLTGEDTGHDSVYREVNRIMVNSGFPDAHLEGKKRISDRDLPYIWNSITYKTKLVIYTDEDLKHFKEVIRQKNGLPPEPPPAEQAPPPKQTPQPPEQTPKPPEQTTPPPEPVSPATQGPDLNALAAQLRARHEHEKSDYAQVRDGQGFVGAIVDGAKNIFQTQNSSSKINERLHQEDLDLKQLEQAAQANDLTQFAAAYKELTGHEFDAQLGAAHGLRAAGVHSKFDQSQHSGVDMVTDAAAALAATATTRFGVAPTAGRALAMSMGGGLVLGAGAKAGLKQIDGRYADIKEDLIMGGIWGMSMPLAEMAGARVSTNLANRLGLRVTGNFITARIETQGAGLGLRALSAAAKSGTSGSLFGAIDGGVRSAMDDLKHDREIDGAALLRRSVTGGVIGFGLGTLLGMAGDGIVDKFRSRRAGPVDPVPPQVVNGVEVPPSGVSSIDDAARLMGQDPADFAAKAANDPYGAVADAAKLYDDLGVNIRKHDPLTGEVIIPQQFDDALGLVHKVDGATPEIGLGQKIPVVREADQFVSAQTAAVTDSLEKIRGDANYQEVIRLTTEQRGAQAAQALEEGFQRGLTQEIKAGTAIERLQNPGAGLDDAFKKAQTEAEAQFLQKAADFFKDMTDPVQRARLNTLVDEIYEKFTPRPITRPQLDEIIAAVPPEQQELAMAILQRSTANSTDVGINLQMRAVRAELERLTGSASPSNVYTLAPDSSGNLLGYLYRKSNSVSMSIQNIDALAEQIAQGSVPSQIVLFDDLTRVALTAEQKAVLQKVPKVIVVDLGAFEKGINVVDFATGSDAVAAKLTSLADEAATASGKHTGLVPTGAAKAVLDDAVDTAAQQIGKNVVVVRPQGTWHSSTMPTPDQLSAMSPVDALYSQIVVPKASKEEIANFLSGYAGTERELAARMLNEGAVHNSFPVIIAKARQVRQQIEQILDQSGAGMSDLLLVVDKDPGGSSHLVSYMFGRANGLPSENFISSTRLNQLISSGQARGKVVAYMDDTIYSGSQTSGMLESNINQFANFRRVIVGSLGAYDRGLSSIAGTHLAKVGKATVATVDRYVPFYSSSHPFYGSLETPLRTKVHNIGGSAGFGDIQGAQIWSYMYPDNNLTFFGKQFAGGILRLPGP